MDKSNEESKQDAKRNGGVHEVSDLSFRTKTESVGAFLYVSG